MTLIGEVDIIIIIIIIIIITLFLYAGYSRLYT
jgi:hypothetical protein